MNVNYAIAIQKLRPNTEYVLNSDDVTQIEWIKPKNTLAITQGEFDSALSEILAEFKSEEKAKSDAKKSAIAKLAALGLTQEEAALLLE
jgi:hypothetical protein